MLRKRLLVIVSIILLYAMLIGTAAALMYLTSRDEENAERYIDILRIMLSWSTLAFAAVVTILLVFHDELRTMISNLYLKNLSPRGAEFDIRPQPEPPAGERGRVDAEDLPLESDEQPIENGSPQDLDIYLRDAHINALRIRNEWLEQEVKRWWARYLAIFLNEPTKAMLEFFDYSSPVSHDEFLDRFDRYYFRAKHIGLQLPPHTRESALHVLKTYELVTDEDGQLRISDQGRELEEFLRTDEGRVLSGGFDGQLFSTEVDQSARDLRNPRFWRSGL